MAEKIEQMTMEMAKRDRAILTIENAKESLKN